MDAPRTPLIRVRKGNTLLLNSTYLRYSSRIKITSSSASRMEAGLICKPLFVWSANDYCFGVSPAPYREYSSYPAEGKVSYS